MTKLCFLNTYLAALKGVEVPNDFNAIDQMQEIVFPIQGAIQISRFEIVGEGNAVMFLMEPPTDHDRVHSYKEIRSILIIS